MSTYIRKTKNPRTEKWQDAYWMDDYFKHHHYGVKFPDGTIIDPEVEKLETSDEATHLGFDYYKHLEEKKCDCEYHNPKVFLENQRLLNIEQQSKPILSPSDKTWEGSELRKEVERWVGNSIFESYCGDKEFDEKISECMQIIDKMANELLTSTTIKAKEDVLRDIISMVGGIMTTGGQMFIVTEGGIRYYANENGINLEEPSK